MNTVKTKWVAAFSAALEEIYHNCQTGQKTNFTQLGKKHGLGVYATFLKKALRTKHLINEDCTSWNPNYTTPNEKLAQQIYLLTKEMNNKVQSEYQQRKKVKISSLEPKQEISDNQSNELKYSLDETVELVKHYGLFKIIWKCLF